MISSCVEKPSRGQRCRQCRGAEHRAPDLLSVGDTRSKPEHPHTASEKDRRDKNPKLLFDICSSQMRMKNSKYVGKQNNGRTRIPCNFHLDVSKQLVLIWHSKHQPASAHTPGGAGGAGGQPPRLRVATQKPQRKNDPSFLEDIMVLSISLGAHKHLSSHLAAENTNNQDKSILTGIKSVL